MAPIHRKELEDLIAELGNQVQALQSARAQGPILASYTSANLPTTPPTGLEVLVTDLGLRAWWNGSKWIYPPQQVGKAVLSANAPSITVPVPSGIFGSLRCTVTGRQDSGSGGAYCFIRLNGDSGNNYVHQNVLGQQATVSAATSGAAVDGIRVGVLPGSGDTSGYVGIATFEVGNASSTTDKKPVVAAFNGMLSTTNGAAGVHGGLWTSTAAVSSVTVYPFTGQLVAGSTLSIVGQP